MSQECFKTGHFGAVGHFVTREMKRPGVGGGEGRPNTGEKNPVIFIFMRIDEQKIARLFLRNGYVRNADTERRAAEGAAYKKGFELRFVLSVGQDYRELIRDLAAAGIKAGQHYPRSFRATQWVVPVYGQEQVERILGWAGEAEGAGAEVKNAAKKAVKKAVKKKLAPAKKES